MLILEIWSNQPGKFFCIAVKTGEGKWREHFFSRDQFSDIKSFLKEQEDCDLYFCPHGFNRRSRTKAEAVIPNLLWADLDFVSPHNMRPKPTIAIESSPGRYYGLWELKEPMTEELNRKLTYYLGADKGGWDLTQLIRIPGTRNYKYAAQPRVRTLWTGGKVYTVANIEKYLPVEKQEEASDGLSAAEVFEEYQDRLPRWVRRELIAKSLTGRADRSEMLWKLENACIEAGMSVNEAFAVIRRSVWNKFAGRRNEKSQLKRELSKILENHFKEKPKGADKLYRKSDEEESEKEHRGLFIFKPLSEIEEEQIDWIWYPYLAKKTLSIIEGDPGLGKSYLAMMMAASISSGATLPCVKRNKPTLTGPVVYFDIENNAASVTKVRLKYNGFDNLNNYYPVEQAFSIEDLDAIEEMYDYLEKIKPVLVVFDTLNTYIGRADTHKASEATQAMNVFKQISTDFDCAVCVLRHLTKGSGSAMYRGQGSVAFAGSARVVMAVGVDPKDPETRVMAITKGNLAPLPGGLSFRIEARPKDRSEFIWEGFNNLTAQEIVDASTEARSKKVEGNGIQEAMEFLESQIKNKPVDVEKLYRMGEKRSIARKMIDRAGSRMNIKKKTLKDGSETWCLRANDSEEEE